MLFLSVQAAAFMAPAHAAPPTAGATEATTHTAGDLAGAAKDFVQTLERAAADAFAFSFFDAPPAPQTGADVPLGDVSHGGGFEAASQALAIDFGMGDHADLAALVKSAVDAAHHDWMF